MPRHDAIEIDSPKVADILTKLDPTLSELDYAEDLHLNFFVLDFPKGGWSIVKADQLQNWAEITPGIKIKTVQLHTK